MVLVIFEAVAIPDYTTGSLEPAFAIARRIGLVVKRVYAHIVSCPLPTSKRILSSSSMTFLEETPHANSPPDIVLSADDDSEV